MPRKSAKRKAADEQVAKHDKAQANAPEVGDMHCTQSTDGARRDDDHGSKQPTRNLLPDLNLGPERSDKPLDLMSFRDRSQYKTTGRKRKTADTDSGALEGDYNEAGGAHKEKDWKAELNALRTDMSDRISRMRQTFLEDASYQFQEKLQDLLQQIADKGQDDFDKSSAWMEETAAMSEEAQEKHTAALRHMEELKEKVLAASTRDSYSKTIATLKTTFKSKVEKLQAAHAGVK